MNNKLYNIIDNAYNNSDYYNLKFVNGINKEMSFKSIPILYKNDIQNEANNILSRKFAYGKKKRLRVERTSGSTGKFTTVYWDKDEFNCSNMVLWRLRNKWYGILPNSKCVTFNSLMFVGNKIHKPEKISYYGNNIMGLSKFHLTDEDFKEYCEAIRHFQPQWMSVQTSILSRLVEYMHRNNIRSFDTLKYIELNGEMSLKTDKKYFQDFFNIPVANMYGATEVNGIAFECPCNKLHVLEENVYLESVEIEGINTAVVTSLHNTAMPIIRYNLGDVLQLGERKKCECGMTSLYIETLQGRSSDVIELHNKQYVSPYIFLYCIEKVNEILYYPILQFKIVQAQLDKIEILIVIRNDKMSWANETIKELKHMIEEMNLPIDIEIIQVKDINQFGNVKFKFFEKHI